MRYLLLAFLLAGCGGVQRSVPNPQPEPKPQYIAHHYIPPGPVASPVYPHPRQAVLAACVLACDTYCHDAPTAVDRDAFTLSVYDKNTWTGSVPLTITLVDLGSTTRMDMEAGEADDYLGDETPLQRKRMQGFADDVRRHLLAAEVAQAMNPAAANGASGTSRP